MTPHCWRTSCLLVVFAALFCCAHGDSPLNDVSVNTPEGVSVGQDPIINEENGYYQLYAYIHSELNGAPSLTGRGRPGSATRTHSCNRVRGVPATLRSATHMGPRGLGSFYQKYTEAYGIPILGSRSLSDSALQRACYIVRFLLAHRYDVRQSYYKYFGRFALMGVNEVTTHIPEHAFLGSWWNQRARGLGATVSAPVSTAGEENILCHGNDRYRSEDIGLHEFSHGVHLLGARYALRGFHSRLTAAYNSARSRGLWANTYSLSTVQEYFAEGVQSYYAVNAYASPPNGIHNHVNTREKLRTYDPTLYNLVREVFPCDIEYIKRCPASGRTQADLRRAEQAQVMTCSGGGGGGTGTGGGGTGTGGGGTGTGGGGNGGNCDDSNRQCALWASDGWCDRCSTWMHENCKKSCNKCSGGGGTGTGGGGTGTGGGGTGTGGRGNCKDNSNHCAYWARIGECQKNPAYMRPNCKKSCRLCTRK